MSRATSSSDRGVAALDLLGALYPPPLSVVFDDRHGQPARAAWTALPSGGNPRLLVPESGPVVQTRVLRRQLTGQRWRTRLARNGLSLAAGSGMLTWLPGLRVAVTGPQGAPSIEDPLRDVLGVDEIRLTMPVGPARSNRKPVLQVTDPTGRVLAFAKVGHTPLTRRLVRQERQALRSLETASLKEVRVPRVIALLWWEGYDVAVLEALVIPSRRVTGEAGQRRLLSVVEEIAAIGRTVIEWRHHPYRPALLAQVGDCGERGAPLRRHVEQVDDRLRFATGAWHGDLNPGNIAVVPGPCPVWDWERFEVGVPVGFDLLHHRLHETITGHRVPAGRAAMRLVAESPRILAPLGVPGEGAAAVARCYLVTLGCRYLLDDQRAAGGDLGRVEEWLFPALERTTP